MRFSVLVAVFALAGASGVAAATDASELLLVQAGETAVQTLLAEGLAAPAERLERLAAAAAQPATPVLERVAPEATPPAPVAAPMGELRAALRLQLLPDGLLVLDLESHATPADLVPLGDVMLRAPSAASAAPVPTLPERAGPQAAPIAPLREADPTTETPPAPVRDGPVATGSFTVAPRAERLPAAFVAGSIAASLLGLLGCALYHRIRPHATLENDTRKAIFEAVCAQPGLGVHAIAKATDVSYSTATYHLERLMGAGMIVMTPNGNKLCYYKNGGAFTEAERRILPLIKNDEASRLLEAIVERPGTYRAELATLLGVTATTINWHLKRLRDAGLVAETRQGRNAHLRALIAECRPQLDSLAQKVGESDPIAHARLVRFGRAANVGDGAGA